MKEQVVEMNNIISSLLQLLTKFFSLKETELGNIEKVDVVKSKRSLTKANDYAEHALLIAERYSPSFIKKDRKRFDYLLKQYRKYN